MITNNYFLKVLETTLSILTFLELEEKMFNFKFGTFKRKCRLALFNCFQRSISFLKETTNLILGNRFMDSSQKDLSIIEEWLNINRNFINGYLFKVTKCLNLGSWYKNDGL
jgi:hypothetical protein